MHPSEVKFHRFYLGRTKLAFNTEIFRLVDIVLLLFLKGRDCMRKVLIDVLVIILIAGSYLILYSAVRVSAISDQRIAEIRSRETFDKSIMNTILGTDWKTAITAYLSMLT